MKVGIDFDRVLFKTDKFKEEVLFEEIKGFEETYSQIDGIYSPRKHAEILEIPVKDILQILEKASDYLYEDVELIKQSEHEFVIVTRGDPVFQEEKLEHSGILNLVKDHKIVQEEDKDVKDIDILVDDLKSEIENADIKGYHFERPEDSIQSLLDFIDGESC